MWSGLLLVGAGLAGAAGVALAATGAHLLVADAALLQTVSVMLITHAGLMVGLVSLSVSTAPLRRYAKVLLAIAGCCALGLLLFCGDLGWRAVTGGRLFMNAAPTGGLLLMGSWLGLAGIAALSAWQGRRLMERPASKRDLH